MKFFATNEILELTKDEKWLNRITVAIYQHWHNRNWRKDQQANIDGELRNADPESVGV